MRIEFHGAAGEVTGSRHLLRVDGRTLLLDCGLIQGGAGDEARNRGPWPVAPSSLDGVILSHAHIDHSGRLPRLVAEGFEGPIFTQRATRDLCDIMLRDSAHLAAKEAETANRKRSRKGLAPIQPLYTVAEAEQAVTRMTGLPYDQWTQVLPGVRLRLSDAGHILGSAIVELELEEEGRQRTLVFSGDLGHRGAPILRDPARPRHADLVLMESTYGNRLHRPREDTVAEIGGILAAARAEGGNVLIPAFAVGRSQDLIYLFARHRERWGLDDWQIWLDSPMAIEATEVYGRYGHLYDDEARALWDGRGGGLLPTLRIARTGEESRRLNNLRGGAIILAGSGMCEGGRIRHHLKNHVWRASTHVVFVGYQARGTLGRRLVEGARNIRLWGEAIRVQATVHTVGGLSAHADQDGLVHWYGAFRERPRVCLVHGEDQARAGLAARLETEFGVTASLPAAGDHLEF